MIHERLKTETRPLHDRTEEIAGSSKIMEGTLSLEQYTEILIRNFLLHREAEHLLGQWSALVDHQDLDFVSRLKTPALESDLRQLGVDISSLPKLSLPREPQDIHQAMGAMYVLEGATLGGAAIHKKLAGSPQISEAKAFNYYTVYGSLIGPRWKSFLQIMEDMVNHPNEEENIMEGARMGYEWVQEAFSIELGRFDASLAK